MSIPLPPGYKKPISNRVPKAPAPPPERSKVLDRDETAFILEHELLPEHAQDPNVVSFIREFLLCRDSKQAAHKLGLTKRDGDNLRRRPDIHSAIVKLTNAACLKHGFDAAEVVERVKEIVQVDPADFQRADGSYVESMHELDPATRRAIKKFKVRNEYGTDPNGMNVVTGRIIEVELWDKMKGVELLGREKDLFKETKRVQHDIATNMSDTLLESKKRAEERMNQMRDVSPPPMIEMVIKGTDE